MSIGGECLGPIGKIQENIIIHVFYKNKRYRNIRFQRQRSLEHLRKLKASESHFLKKFANKQLILLLILNAKNILRTRFGSKSANLKILEGFL